jgi:lipoprotein NlpI
MNLIAYFNLGIYLRQADDLEKSYEIFNEIIARLSKAKL